MPANLTESIEIDAAVSAVWRVASDLARMGEWSPQTRKVLVRGGQMREGTHMVNINRLGWKVWPTTAKVVAFEPARRIAFRINENHSVWSFDLEPIGAGDRTRLTQTRDVSGGTTQVSRKLIETFLGGEDQFESDLRTGMRQTLERIKQESERPL